MDLVSVIMPAYNAEKTIEIAVNSLERQTYPNIEIIIVNDGSTDNTDTICLKMAEANPKIKYYSISNGGVSNARNVGIGIANGEYITFLDSDDYMESEMINSMMKAMRDDVDLVCSGYYVCSPNGNKMFFQCPMEGIWDVRNYDKGIAELQEKKAFNILWNKLFRTTIIKENGLRMNRKIKMGEDLLFVISYINNMRKKLVCLPNILYNYTLSPNGAQANLKDHNALLNRLDQLYELEPLYLREGYQMDSIYAEQLRCIYTSLLEVNDIERILDIIYNDQRCLKMLKNYKPINAKFVIFKHILLFKNKNIISFLINCFKLFKIKRGTSYQWK